MNHYKDKLNKGIKLPYEQSVQFSYPANEYVPGLHF